MVNGGRPVAEVMQSMAKLSSSGSMRWTATARRTSTARPSSCRAQAEFVHHAARR